MKREFERMSKKFLCNLICVITLVCSCGVCAYAAASELYYPGQRIALKNGNSYYPGVYLGKSFFGIIRVNLDKYGLRTTTDGWIVHSLLEYKGFKKGQIVQTKLLLPSGRNTVVLGQISEVFEDGVAQIHVKKPKEMDVVRYLDMDGITQIVSDDSVLTEFARELNSRTMGRCGLAFE